MVKKFTLPEFGYTVEIGKVANQANGAAWFKHGGTVVLATAVSDKTQDFPGFLPLTVDYREQFSAAGKIPGGYFKREGKNTDKEVLTARLIDRTIRPLFPEAYFDQVQVIATVFSVDADHMPATISLIAASIALTISDIPFIEPVGAIEVARLHGDWIFSPTYQQAQDSDVRIVVAGTAEGINMVEGSMDGLPEDELVNVLFKAHDKIKSIIAWQKEIQQEVGKENQVVNETDVWQQIKKLAREFLTNERMLKTFLPDKPLRSQAMKALKAEFVELVSQELDEESAPEKLIAYMYEKAFAARATDMIFERKQRLDGRGFKDVRQINNEVGLLPHAHGSALFKRGNTQALASLTLGGGQDQQQVEMLMGTTQERTFMLHYNFPPFSSGEVKFMRGPGRREVGHGYLAASALKSVLPSEEDFPYTKRIVVDILESDGSTSMATTCVGTMALMNAGVPIKQMVSGIAMGLLQSSQTKDFFVLSDINGSEDAYGLMDLKVTGTVEGVTALQMDIKYKGGLSREVFEMAFVQAREGRLHILKEMQKVMTEPSPTLSPYVPQVVKLNVPVEKIGAIIGSGGKVIKEIIEKTGTSIDIEDDGSVKIFGQPGEDLEKAISWVHVLAGKIDQGQRFEGKIKRITDFGVFVEIAPDKDGLIHISKIDKAMQTNLSTSFPVGDTLAVEVLDYDKASGRIRLKQVNSTAA